MLLTSLSHRMLALAALLAFLHSGAIADPKKLPDELKDEGLLVFEIVRHPDIRHTGQRWIRQAVINGKRYADMAEADHMRAVALPPGEYKLDALVAVGARESTYIGGVHLRGSPATSWSVDRPFVIEAGKVTNLGQFVFHQSTDNPQQYAIRYIDNSTDLPPLEKLNPTLAASLTPEKFVLAPGNYLSAPQLEALRLEFARRDLKGLTAAQLKHTHFVVDTTGTVAILDKPDASKPPAVKIVDIGHSRTPLCTDWRKGVACLAKGNSILLLDGAERRTIDYPKDFKPYRIHTFGDSGVVLADELFRFVVSKDGGANWTAYNEAAFDKTYIGAYPRFHNGARGFYVYSAYAFGEGAGIRLLYAPYETAQLQPLPRPQAMKTIATALETKQGLYLSPRTSYSDTTTTLYFTPIGKSEPEIMSIPASFCSRLFADDADGQQLTAVCATRTSMWDKEDWHSSDGGKTWTK